MKATTRYQMTVTVAERNDFNGHYSIEGKKVHVVRGDSIDECWEQIERMLADGERPDETSVVQ